MDMLTVFIEIDFTACSIALFFIKAFDAELCGEGELSAAFCPDGVFGFDQHSFAVMSAAVGLQHSDPADNIAVRLFIGKIAAAGGGGPVIKQHQMSSNVIGRVELGAKMLFFDKYGFPDVFCLFGEGGVSNYLYHGYPF